MAIAANLPARNFEANYDEDLEQVLQPPSGGRVVVLTIFLQSVTCRPVVLSLEQALSTRVRSLSIIFE